MEKLGWGSIQNTNMEMKNEAKTVSEAPEKIVTKLSTAFVNEGYTVRSPSFLCDEPQIPEDGAKQGAPCLICENKNDRGSRQSLEIILDIPTSWVASIRYLVNSSRG